MRYVVYNIRAMKSGVVLSEQFKTAEHAQEWCAENNREFARIEDTERLEPVRKILWLTAFVEIANTALALAFLVSWWHHDLRQASFLVLARVILFGLPVVNPRQMQSF